MLETMKLDIALSIEQLLSEALEGYWLSYRRGELQVTDTCMNVLISEDELEKICIKKNLHEEFLLCRKLYREVGDK